MCGSYRLMSLSALLVAGGPVVVSDEAGQKVNKPTRVPQEVLALAGVYIGSWTMYGIDDKGQVVQKMAWTDTMTAAGPEVKGGRAFVTTTDEMKFDGAKGPPFKVEGKEGYFLSKDGGLGDYFIEANGQVQRVTRLGTNVWTYAAPAAEAELSRLGFPRGASGQHVVVKVVTADQGVETHRISRVTTVNWKDKDTQDRALQFVSLQGHHRRQS
jgi:hypothetical protein